LVVDIKGTELFRILKEKQLKMVRKIIVGHPSVENAAQSVKEKADGYISKPFNVLEFLKILNKLFEKKTNALLKMVAEIGQVK